MEYQQQLCTQPVTDDEIIARVLNGEPNAYALIMRRHNQRLYRIVRSYVRDEDEIEDVMQDAYLKAYEQLPRFERRAQFSTWLIRIAINEALARVRRNTRFVAPMPEDRSGSDAPASEAIHLSDDETPIRTLMNTELKEILEHAVDRLPEKYRVVFVMREIEGLSVAETGSALDTTETNVKVRLNRAKGMLQHSISDVYRGLELYHFDLVRCDRIVAHVTQRIQAVAHA